MYVATPQGYRRKIGPRSRYGTTSNESAYGDGVGPQGAQSSMNRRSGFSGQTLGSGRSSLDEHFGSNADRVSRERAEREKADQYLFDQEKRRSDEARKREEAAKAPQQPSQEAKNAAGVAAYGSGKPPTAGVASVLDDARRATERAARAKQEAADRAKGRAKYEAEKSGKAPSPAMAEKKPEPRKEAVMPKAAHSSPARAPAPKPTPKPEAKLTAPHMLFADRAPKPASAPEPKTRAIDSYVSNPANRSVMTGKSRAQEIAAEAAAKKKREADNMFRPKYMPNKARF